MRCLRKLMLLAGTTFYSCTHTFGQFSFNIADFKLKTPPKSAYRIIQKEEGIVKRISEFDVNGKLIFKYHETEIIPYWNTPHIFIRAYEYDSIERIIKEYDFNSNAGLSLYLYEYGDLPSIQTMYKHSYPKAKESNENSYVFISKFRSFELLKNSLEVATILLSPGVKEYINELNEEGKPVGMNKYINIRNGETVITKYNSQGERVLMTTYNTLTYEKEREVITTYIPNTIITEIIYYKQGNVSSKYKFAEKKDPDSNTKITYSESIGTSNIRQYFYDKDSCLRKVTVYKSPSHSDLIVPINNDLEKTAEMSYRYNERGLLESETMRDYIWNKKQVRRYEYKVELLD